MLAPSGNTVYQDPYGTIFETRWTTSGDLVNITTITRDPRIWGQEPQGYVKNHTVFRMGMITTIRQTLRALPDIGGRTKYEKIAETVSHATDYIQTNFPVGPAPKNNFKYSLNNWMQDWFEFEVTDGQRWIGDPNDSDITWGIVNPDGSVDNPVGSEALQWIDIWS